METMTRKDQPVLAGAPETTMAQRAELVSEIFTPGGVHLLGAILIYGWQLEHVAPVVQAKKRERHAEFIRDLRAATDWLEAHPEAGIPWVPSWDLNFSSSPAAPPAFDHYNKETIELAQTTVHGSWKLDYDWSIIDGLTMAAQSDPVTLERWLAVRSRELTVGAPIGDVKKYSNELHTGAKRNFGSLQVSVAVENATVCERRETGQTKIVKVLSDEDKAAFEEEKRRVLAELEEAKQACLREVEVPVIETVCPPFLAP